MGVHRSILAELPAWPVAGTASTNGSNGNGPVRLFIYFAVETAAALQVFSLSLSQQIFEHMYRILNIAKKITNYIV